MTGGGRIAPVIWGQKLQKARRTHSRILADFRVVICVGECIGDLASVDKNLPGMAFRMVFVRGAARANRKITGWAMDFMTRSKQAGKPFYMYLPYTQVHIPPIPDPEYAGRTKCGNWADLLTQIDDFTGMILDKLDELGLVEDTIVVWTSDNRIRRETRHHREAVALPAFRGILGCSRSQISATNKRLGGSGQSG